jgi:hypothetical protein
MIDPTDLRTFKQIEAEMPAFPYNRLRYLYANQERNGTKAMEVFAKVGNIRMVVKPNFRQWINRQVDGRVN